MNEELIERIRAHLANFIAFGDCEFCRASGIFVNDDDEREFCICEAGIEIKNLCVLLDIDAEGNKRGNEQSS